jgi:hypothetical protein
MDKGRPSGSPRLFLSPRPGALQACQNRPLDGNISGVYSGSLTHVISRLLGGYDYVIAHDRGTIELVVSDTRRKRRLRHTGGRVQIGTPAGFRVGTPGRLKLESSASAAKRLRRSKSR